jgi:hypothetical protein
VIAYTYHVKNTGTVSLHALKVTDSLIGAVSCPRSTLEPGESMTCTASYRIRAADVKRGYVTNAATVIGKTPNEAEVRERSTRTLPFTGVRPAPPRPAPVPPITKVPVRVTG